MNVINYGASRSDKYGVVSGHRYLPDRSPRTALYDVAALLKRPFLCRAGVNGVDRVPERATRPGRTDQRSSAARTGRTRPPARWSATRVTASQEPTLTRTRLGQASGQNRRAASCQDRKTVLLSRITNSG